MKKAIVQSFIALICVSSSFAATMDWGAVDPDTGNPIAFSYTDGGGSSTFQGVAYLFLLSGQANTVNYSGGSWNVAAVGAKQIAIDASGQGLGAGAWGATTMDLLNSDVLGASYYQVILVNQTGQANLTGVTSGFWAGTTAITPQQFDSSSGDNVGGVYWKTLADGSTGGSIANWQPVPEPTSMALFGLGAAVLGLRRKFRKQG